MGVAQGFSRQSIKCLLYSNGGRLDGIKKLKNRFLSFLLSPRPSLSIFPLPLFLSSFHGLPLANFFLSYFLASFSSFALISHVYCCDYCFITDIKHALQHENYTSQVTLKLMILWGFKPLRQHDV
jgi:hypothetical protein